MVQQVSSTFVGRAADLEQLTAAYRDPQVAAVLVAGEAGLGKSRLVGEFGSRLPAGVRVLTGRCPEFGSAGVAFGPFLAVARALVRSIGADGLRMLLAGPVPELARWVPELATDVPAGEPDRTRLFGEVLILLDALAQQGPLVLVLEDLHWADDASLDLLSFLIANLDRADVLLVGTYRPPGPGRLHSLLTELSRLPSVVAVEPRALTRHDVGRQLAALLGREPEPGFAGRVFERSGGNPLFVEALSRSAADAPAALGELLLAGLPGLSATTQRVLQVAAVAGSPVEHELLSAAASLDDDTLDAAVGELIGARLLQIHGSGYEFRHALIREAVYDSLLPARRTRLHAGLAAVLRAAAGPESASLVPPERYSAELARHSECAGDIAGALASGWQAAADAAATGSRAAQLHHLRRMLDLWDRVGPEQRPVDRAALLELFADVCAHQGAVEPGLAAVEEALGIVAAQAGSAQDRGRLLTVRARLRNQAGGGRADLQEALEVLGAAPTVLRAKVLLESASVHLFTGEPAGAAADAEAALEIAAGFDSAADPEVAAVLARAHAFLGLAAADRPELASGHFETARKLAPDAETLLAVVVWESAFLVATGAYGTAIEVIGQGLRAACDTFRFVEKGPILIVKWVQALEALGRWPEALTLIDDTLADPIPPLSRAVLLLCHGRIMAAQGDSAAGAVSAATVEPLLRDSAWAGQYVLESAGLRADLALNAADLGAAREIVERALRDGARHHHEVWALLVTGARAGLDHRALAAALPVTTAPDSAYRSTWAATVSGDPADWRTAIAAWAELGRPFDRAVAEFACARASLAAGDRSGAREILAAATARAAALGADGLVSAMADTVRRAGLAAATTAPPAPPRSFGLTTRELEVLRLIARGLSNRAIGAELFISGNTAGVHVSRIITKLGASSRTEAAALARDAGLID
ncbi:ATP-binding protein [Nocardia stercoris]|uniref:Helix-turn-helix transcriptional regulator n=1 Tax=Nocardia stercoris TaxID=2483361 RepID=A0A3M2L882_9NOCA|nr:helix-turn-helix transcriptional regulator [Nocardia stercoris]RMI32880.1 helix-turn-helix transcriptional regulator [Nocardia stercoris]